MENKKIHEWKKVYVASRYAGDIDHNVKNAAKACRFVARVGAIPIATHLMYPNMGFDDKNPEDRSMCLQFGHALIGVCDEVWVFLEDGIQSEGVKGEIEYAVNHGVPVRYFDVAEIDAF